MNRAGFTEAAGGPAANTENGAGFTVLALDTSGAEAGLCIWQNGAPRFLRRLAAGPTHSETLLPLVDEGLRRAKLHLCELSLLAVTAGPGSFTGLRIGMALVKGLGLAGGAPALGLSTLHALAAACTLGPFAPRGTLIAAADARRGELYWAAFDTRGPLCRLTQDAAGPPRDIEAAGLLRRAPVFFVGSGAEMCYNVFGPGEDGPWHYAQKPPLIAAGAALLAETLYKIRPAGSAAQLRPVYLRLSQAERERTARSGPGALALSPKTTALQR